MSGREDGNGQRTLSAQAAELAAGLARLQAKHGHFTLQMSFATVASLVSCLQLALRHPANVGETAQVGRELVDRINAAIESAGEPRAAELLRRGDDPSCDVEVRTCRVCGCTDDGCRQCVEAQGHPCHWVEADLCSRCAASEVNQAGDAGGKDG
jgi:hypothetical protein